MTGMPASAGAVIEAGSQLWREEREVLAELGRAVPPGGTVVEIGTGLGSSAAVFDAACRPGVRIYSFDVAPSPDTRERLRTTAVTVVQASSLEGAAWWGANVGDPIDLLFIDGGHSAKHVYEDFNAWTPLARPGSRVAFHDYDLVERGGLAHLGVRLVVDAVQRCGLLRAPVHRHRVLHGIVERPVPTPLSVDACWRRFVDLGREIVEVRDADYSGYVTVGDAQLDALLRICLKLDERVPRKEPAPPSRKYLVFTRPFQNAIATLGVDGGPVSVVTIDSLQICYILAGALSRHRHRLVGLTSSRHEFFRWEEALDMFDHGCGSSFPDRAGATAGSTIEEFSRILAREQVRVMLLSQLLRTFVDWNP